MGVWNVFLFVPLSTCFWCAGLVRTIVQAHISQMECCFPHVWNPRIIHLLAAKMTSLILCAAEIRVSWYRITRYQCYEPAHPDFFRFLRVIVRMSLLDRIKQVRNLILSMQSGTFEECVISWPRSCFGIPKRFWLKIPSWSSSNCCWLRLFPKATLVYRDPWGERDEETQK